MSLPELSSSDCPGLEINDPPVDFVGLARSLGVEAQRLDNPAEITDAVRHSLRGDRPRLIEVPIAK